MADGSELVGCTAILTEGKPSRIRDAINDDQQALLDARLATGSLGGSFGEAVICPSQRSFYSQASQLVPSHLDPRFVDPVPLTS